MCRFVELHSRIPVDEDAMRRLLGADMHFEDQIDMILEEHDDPLAFLRGLPQGSRDRGLFIDWAMAEPERFGLSRDELVMEVSLPQL